MVLKELVWMLCLLKLILKMIKSFSEISYKEVIFYFWLNAFKHHNYKPMDAHHCEYNIGWKEGAD